MEFLGTLWLPILLSAVFVFVASSIIHMVISWHRSDYQGMPAEADVMAKMREAGLKPGHYMFPHFGDMKEAMAPEGKAKYDQGPVGFMTVIPDGMPNMGKGLLQWFVYSIVVSIFCAYIAHHSIEPGTDYLQVFRIIGPTAMLAYSLGGVPESIWKGLSWSITFRFFVDGVIYATVTAGTFGWLWPAAS